MKNDQQERPLNSQDDTVPSQPLQPTVNPQQNQGNSGVAIAGMVLGIVGIATSFMPIINNISFFIGLVGLVLGIVGLVGINKGKKKGRGFAIAAIVLNVLTAIVVLASQAFYSSVLDSVSDSVKSTSTTASQATSSSIESSDAAASAGATTASADDSKYAITIDDAREDTDYEGARSLVVTYTFTNNSDSDTQFFTAISDKAFQNGVELESTFNVSSWNAGNDDTKTVKTGSTITVEQGYKLVDSSPVTVEVTELLSFDKTILATETFDVA